MHVDGKYVRYPPKTNSIAELRKWNKNQADQPMRGIDDDIIMEERDPVQALKNQLSISQPHVVSNKEFNKIHI